MGEVVISYGISLEYCNKHAHGPSVSGLDGKNKPH